MSGEIKRLSEEDLDELDELIEFYQGIEDCHGWTEAVRILAVFGPDPAVVRLVEHRAYHRAAEERSQYNYDAAGRFTGAGDALAVLAERVERRIVHRFAPGEANPGCDRCGVRDAVVRLEGGALVCERC